MAKQQSKKQRKTRPKGRGRAVVELKSKEPKTAQKTVRVPMHILAWLETRAANVKPAPISVPSAIVQILESEYLRDGQKLTGT